MTRRYENPAAFRQALTDRLRADSARGALPTESLRTKLVIERLLARLFHREDPPWLLKGGYAFELRFRPKARTTRDVDLSILGTTDDGWPHGIAELRDALQVAADLDLGDHLQFAIGAPKRRLQGPPGGGATFPVEARIAGKAFGLFHVDAGMGDAIVGEPEELIAEDRLGFAGIPPPRVFATSRAQQFAEKLHAYTLEWTDRENTRVKDLVDMVLLIERGALDPAEVRAAVHATFDRRAKQPVPGRLAPPPASWTDEFAALAAQAALQAAQVDVAFQRLAAFRDSAVGSPSG
jgi:hypothetical protein